ncbi:hypothetical protein BH10PLA2_BH10PLA2_24190 [soil metagenome]
MPAEFAVAGLPLQTQVPALSAELRLLCLCARVDLTDSDRRRIEEMVCEPLDWTLLVKLAHRHCCFALLHRHLNAVCPDAAPPGLMQSLHQQCQRQAIHNLKLTADLLKIVSALARVGIDALPYKGPILTQIVYGNLALRQFDDLDILVRQRDLDRARIVLKELGFKPLHENLSGFFVENSFHYVFLDPRSEFNVELHWGLVMSYIPLKFKGERLWKDLRRIPFGGLSVLGHNLEDLVLALCIHGGKHHWLRLSWIIDVAELIRRNPDLDWNRLLEEAQRLHCRRFVMLGLHLAATILGAPVPIRVQEQIARDTAVQKLAVEVWGGLTLPEEVSWDGLKNVAYYCRVRERLRDRLVFVIRRTITPTEFEVNWQLLPRPLHFLYFPLRFVRMTIEYGGSIAGRLFGKT